MNNKEIQKAKKQIESLQKKQDEIYSALCKKLKIKRDTRADDFLFDFVFNDCQYSDEQLKNLLDNPEN